MAVEGKKEQCGQRELKKVVGRREDIHPAKAGSRASATRQSSLGLVSGHVGEVGLPSYPASLLSICIHPG